MPGHGGNDAARLAVIEADITALLAQKRQAETAATDAHDARIRGGELAHDATLAQEHAELMVEVLDGQIEEQFAVRDALVPKQRRPG